jgi:hypothetical protein
MYEGKVALFRVRFFGSLDNKNHTHMDYAKSQNLLKGYPQEAPSRIQVKEMQSRRRRIEEMYLA